MRHAWFRLEMTLETATATATRSTSANVWSTSANVVTNSGPSTTTMATRLMTSQPLPRLHTKKEIAGDVWNCSATTLTRV